MIQEVNQLVDIKVGGFATTPDRKRNDQLTVIHFGLKRYLMPHCRLGSHSMVPHLSTKMAIVQTPWNEYVHTHAEGLVPCNFFVVCNMCLPFQ